MDNEIYKSIENIINKNNSNESITNQKINSTRTVPPNEKLINFLGITRKSGNIVLGMDSVKQGIFEKDIKLILVTEDISNNSLEEIKKFAAANGIKFFKISYSKDNIFNLFGKYSAIIGIKNENFINKITEIISSSFESTEIQNK